MDLLDRFLEVGVLNHLEVEFARLLGRCTNYWDETALLMSALACRAPRVGDICIDVQVVDRTVLSEDGENLVWPSVEERLRAVENAPFIGRFVEGEKPPPLIYEENRLYLYRYYQDEVRLARNVLCRVSHAGRGIASKLDLSDCLDPDLVSALRILASSSLVIITGGPGTGKTTLASKIVAHLVKSGVDSEAILAVAPTGRAAARLGEVMSKNLGELKGFDHRSNAKIEPATIHRALGIHPDSPFKARFNPSNQAEVAMLVMDEASMVDLVTMTRVFEALPDDCLVLLLGDPDQLASVEAGSVLRDLCEANSLSNVVQRLTKCHRFHETIGKCAELVRDGSLAVLDMLRETSDTLHYDDASSSDWLETVVGQAVREFETVVEQAKNGSLSAADIAHSRFRLLCALRKGRHGSEALNGLIKRRLAGERETWFPGRVVMVTENDPKRGLFNGDVGVAIRVEGKTKVAFPDYVSGSKPRLFEPFSLPNFEDAFATTIHKAQGSEAENIVLVFPPDDSPILSRELLYTGITRAKERLCIFAKPDVIARCLERSIHRASGLRKMLAS